MTWLQLLYVSWLCDCRRHCMTKLFVVQHRALVYSALKVQILAPRFKFYKCVMLMTMFVFPFFPNVFPFLLISLCFPVSCTGFSHCNAVNHACQSHQDLANSALMPNFLSIIYVYWQPCVCNSQFLP